MLRMNTPYRHKSEILKYKLANLFCNILPSRKKLRNTEVHNPYIQHIQQDYDLGPVAKIF